MCDEEEQEHKVLLVLQLWYVCLQLRIENGNVGQKRRDAKTEAFALR